MSFATVASAKFTDEGSINNSEAVEVMSMINVINGYTDGTFRPSANVKRAEMAKMVAYIVAGGEDVGDLYAGANSFTDCTTHWAKGYIAYASKTGIVAGVGNGKFNPEGSVTGVQAAKMMLCALGYDAAIQGYVNNESWSVNILKDAKSAGLLDGLNGVDMNAALSRENAALLMFNALKADMVEYEQKGSTITVNGMEIVQGATAPKSVENKDEKNNYAGTGTDGNRPAGYGYTQLCEEYFSDLSLKTATDAFGRTGNQWTYKNGTTTTESAVYADDPDYTIVVSKNDKDAAEWAKEAYSKLTVKSGNVVSVNGAAADAVANIGDLKVGDVVEFYLSDTTDNQVDNIYVIRYEADVITEVDTDVTDDDADDGVSAYITFEKAGQFDDTDITGYDASTYKKDAVVALIVGDAGNADYKDTVVASYVPEVKEGAITAYSTANSTYTMGGTKYTMVGGIADNDGIKGKVDFDDGNYKLYLDKNGYVLKTEIVKGTASITDVFYMSKINGTDFYWVETETVKGKTTNTYYVQAVYLDGTIKDIEIACDDGDTNLKSAIETELGKIKKPGFFTDEVTEVTYDGSKTDEITLKAWSDSDYKVSTDLATGAIEIKEADKTLDSKYLTSNTNYVVAESYDDDAATTTKTGGISFAGKATDEVYVISDADTNEALYVVIVTDSYSTAATGDFFYVASATKTTVSGGTQYTVIGMDGKETEIVVDKTNSSVKELEAGKLYEYAVLTNGNYNVTGEVKDNVATTYYVSHFGTLLTVNGNSKVVETSGAAIYDDHDTDVYSKNINTLAAMKTASEDWNVNLIVVYADSDKDEAKMIVVTGVSANSSNVMDSIVSGSADVNGTMVATPSVNGNDVTMDASEVADYTSKDEGDVKLISADLARFLGGLYKAGGASQIVYDGATYKWNAEGKLASSNWQLNGSGNTLVKDITDDWKGSNGTWGDGDDTPYTATLIVDGVTMTYTVNIAK